MKVHDWIGIDACVQQPVNDVHARNRRSRARTSRSTAARTFTPRATAPGAASATTARGASPTEAAASPAAARRGFAIDSGHYLPEENPQATAEALLGFFAPR